MHSCPPTIRTSPLTPAPCLYYNKKQPVNEYDSDSGLRMVNWLSWSLWEQKTNVSRSSVKLLPVSTLKIQTNTTVRRLSTTVRKELSCPALQTFILSLTGSLNSLLDMIFIFRSSTLNPTPSNARNMRTAGISKLARSGYRFSTFFSPLKCALILQVNEFNGKFNHPKRILTVCSQGAQYI